MPKAKAGKAAAPAAAAVRTAPSDATPPAWPTVPVPRSLAPETLLEQQIVLLPALLSPAACAAIVALFTPPSPHAAQLLPSPAARRGEAQRTNARFQVNDAAFAAALYAALAPAVAQWSEAGLPAAGLHPKIRVYRYSPGDIFGAHYDGHIDDDAHPQRRSGWTVLVYLTGEEDGVVGGQTVFYTKHKKNDKDKVVAPLKRGMALLHRHGQVSVAVIGRSDSWRALPAVELRLMGAWRRPACCTRHCRRRAAPSGSSGRT